MENLFNFFQLFSQSLRNPSIKVIFNNIFRILMQDAIRHDIINLENDILQIEDSIMEFLRPNNDQELKKALHELKLELKHLSILANGAPLDKTDARKTMDFLRTHYDHLQELSLPA